MAGSGSAAALRALRALRWLSQWVPPGFRTSELAPPAAAPRRAPQHGLGAPWPAPAGGDELKPFLSKKKHALALYCKPAESGGGESGGAPGVLARAAGGAAPVTLVAVDCADEPEPCQAVLSGAGVATPVVKYYHFLDGPGGDHDYDGRLQMADLTRFVRLRVGADGGGGGQDADDPDGSAHWRDVLHLHREAVVLLNDASFDAALRRSLHVLVFFYAPWCNHCAQVKHAYAAAAHQLAEEGMRGCMAAVEYSTSPLLERRLGLEFLPAFKLFYKGEFKGDHHKLRTKDDFVYLMKRESGNDS